MGDASERPLFDLKTAKQFMQTMLHASTIKDLIEAEKTSSLRGVFYKAKHTSRARKRTPSTRRKRATRSSKTSR
jgi:DNA topoisomerase VI subunit A